MAFAQRRNRPTTHFSERIPVAKWRISVMHIMCQRLQLHGICPHFFLEYCCRWTTESLISRLYGTWMFLTYSQNPAFGLYPETGECIQTCTHSFNPSNPRSTKCALVLTLYIGNVLMFLFLLLTHLILWHVIIETWSFEELKLWRSLNAVFSSFIVRLTSFLFVHLFF